MIFDDSFCMSETLRRLVRDGEALRSVLGASDQLSNPDVASEPICGEVGAWLTILIRALRFTSERSCRHRC